MLSVSIAYFLQIIADYGKTCIHIFSVFIGKTFADGIQNGIDLTRDMCARFFPFFR